MFEFLTANNNNIVHPQKTHDETDLEYKTNLSTRAALADAVDQQKLDKLVLITEALWTLLKDHTDLSEDDLKNRVLELDMLDGVKDGKRHKLPVDCPKCNAKINMRFQRCLFCGEEYRDGMTFDSL